MRLDISINAACICPELRAVFGSHRLQPFFCCCSDPKNPLPAVVFHSNFAENF